jgi:hypothetical protein
MEALRQRTVVVGPSVLWDRVTDDVAHLIRGLQFVTRINSSKCSVSGPMRQLRSHYDGNVRMSSMGRLIFGSLRDAWKGEAADFTPLLAEQVDEIGSAIGQDLVSIGKVEVATAGGRRIDILADGVDGAKFVIENQYGVLNHDHLTRGLAYAVASHARGLIVIAEEHRDEFRAVAQYLNDLRDNDPERGVAVWLVEAKAVRIGDSPWAPIFEAVISPNTFTAAVELEQTLRRRRLAREDFEALFDSESDEYLKLSSELLDWWKGPDWRSRIMASPAQVVLESRGPGINGWRTVIGFYPNGQVAVPFGAYEGLSGGIAIEALVANEFRSYADALFGFNGTEVQAKTVPGWLTLEKLQDLKKFCTRVAGAFLEARVEYGSSSSEDVSITVI